MSRDERALWLPFVRAALVAALVGGFGLGAALFDALALRLPLGGWWPVAAQAHGHSQLFGWAGLMVLGVGFHFLPRLRGAPLVHPAWAWLSYRGFVVGLTLRVVAQPALALALADSAQAYLWRALLLASGVAEVVAGGLAVAVLVATFRQGPPLAARVGLRVVLPWFAAAFASFWLALALNLVGVGWAATAGQAVVPAWLNDRVVTLALLGFLVPIAIGMSARLLPLYLHTTNPRAGLLTAGLVCWLAGLTTRLSGVATLVAVSRLGQVLALGCVFVALGILARRRPLPRAPRPVWTDPLRLQLLSAYGWLLVLLPLSLWDGLAGFGLTGLAAPLDVERHLLGSGFITLLILGAGAQLIPGFARRSPRAAGLTWATLVLGNLSAVLRVTPLLLGAVVPARLALALLASAGVLGMAAVATFAVNLFTGPTRLPRQPAQPGA